MDHWSEKYVGKRWQRGVYDCASLAIEVQKDEFGRVIELPVERRHYPNIELSALIDLHKADMAVRIEHPVEGDVVLMLDNNRLNHIGTYIVIGKVPYVLHNLQKAGVVIHRLSGFGKGLLTNMVVEGFYRFINKENNTSKEADDRAVDTDRSFTSSSSS